MRKALDLLYRGALAGACLAMIVIAALVFIQVLARVLDRIVVFFGMQRYGFIIPSLAEIGGFLFVAAAFLALAATLRSAGHVRVTLMLRYFGAETDRIMTLLVLIVAIALTGFALWAVGTQTLASYARASVSYGILAIPLWIPQAVMTAGIGIFAIALVDELVAVLRGGDAAFRVAELSREAGEGGH